MEPDAATTVALDFRGRWKRVKGRSVRSLEGHYFDPKHGGCFRTVRRRLDGQYTILGVYGNDEMRPAGEFWSATVRVGVEKTDTIPMVVSFEGKQKEQSSKTLRADFYVDSKTILWEDGNRWLPCYCHLRQFVGDMPRSVRSSYAGTNTRAR